MRVRQKEGGMRLDIFLCERLNISRKKAKELLDQRLVFVDFRRTWIAHHPVEPGSIIEVIPAAPRPPTAWRAILHQDRHLIIVYKNAGYLSEGEDSVEYHLRRSLGIPSLRIVHRLDQDTSGCLMLAFSESVRRKCVALFRARKVRKSYLAVVHGRLARPRTIRAALDGRPAVSRIQPVVARSIASLVRVETLTGRRHQVRRHLAMIGHPVAGDRMYATEAVTDDRLRAIPRQMLHADSLRFPSLEDSAKTLVVKARPPEDFTITLSRLGLRSGNHPP